MTLFDVVFSGNDAVYGLTEKAIDDAIAANGADKAVAFPDTAYSLPCYYAVTGTKVTNLGELKEALGVVKTLMTREQRPVSYTHLFPSGKREGASSAELVRLGGSVEGKPGGPAAGV